MQAAARHRKRPALGKTINKSVSWIPILSGARSFLATFSADAQFLRGMEPVILGRSLRTASGLPKGVRQRCDVLVPKVPDAVLHHSVPVRLLGLLVSLLGVLKSPPGELLPGLMILFLMGFRRTAMSMGGTIVQLGGALVIFVT
jgi:hypothetical protein